MRYALTVHTFDTRAHNAKQCKHAEVRQPLLSALSTDYSAVIVGIIVATTSTASAIMYLFIIVVIVISIRYLLFIKQWNPL